MWTENFEHIASINMWSKFSVHIDHSKQNYKKIIIVLLHIKLKIICRLNRKNRQNVLTFVNKKGYNEYNNRDTKCILSKSNVSRNPICGVQVHRCANVTRSPTSDK